MKNVNKMTWQIKRETSKYNKYMKWHLEYFGNGRVSLFFKTKKEAIYHVDQSIKRGKEGFPIGSEWSYIEYTEAIK